ncbi:MAG: hydrogenase formation protein HypD [Dethiosulfovibrio peptidovorans]|nr:MAG: hydrogenase formation protein HypD [Dethiosulfovibrio peptidovorans]
MISKRLAVLKKALHRLRQPITVMEVCGTHTVSIFRHGLRTMLPENLRLVSGPGCPVCVTAQGEVDTAIALAEREDLILATYGDMIRVPGSHGTLSDKRAQGARISVVLSAMDALALAWRYPDHQVVFLGVGFETTAPATAALILQAKKEAISNLSVLCLHKKVPPALNVLASREKRNMDALLLPGHVAVILGKRPFEFLPKRYGIPCAIAGFEPDEILLGLAMLLDQIASGSPKVDLCYPRVRPQGNPKAQALMDRIFRSGAATWRGLGSIEHSGLEIAPEYADFDASRRFSVPLREVPEPTGCRCGDVLIGEIDPDGCPLFSTLCTPTDPVGPCMVSSEGTCSAWHQYARRQHELCRH